MQYVTFLHRDNYSQYNFYTKAGAGDGGVGVGGGSGGDSFGRDAQCHNLQFNGGEFFSFRQTEEESPY